MHPPRSRALAILPLLTLLSPVLLGCHRSETRPPAPREPGPLRIVASIPPLESLARDLAPAGAETVSIIAPGQFEHSMETRPTDLNRLARADLVVVVGLGMEAPLPLQSLDPTRQLSMSAALGLAQSEENHAHNHEHSGPDPHLWLDPVLVAEFVPPLAERVRSAALAAGATQAEVQAVTEHEAALLATIRSVDAACRERLAPFAGAAIITQHAAWSRLAERYGLKIVGIIQDAEAVEPSAGHLADLLATARAKGVRAVFTEPQVDPSVARRIAAQLGLPVGTLDPLGQGSWADTMLANLDALVTALGAPPEPPPG